MRSYKPTYGNRYNKLRFSFFWEEDVFHEMVDLLRDRKSLLMIIYETLYRLVYRLFVRSLRYHTYYG